MSSIDTITKILKSPKSKDLGLFYYLQIDRSIIDEVRF